MNQNTGATATPQLNIERSHESRVASPETPSRHEGSQPENQNRSVHGFYSKRASPTRQEVMDEAAALEGLDAEIVLLRSKIERLEELDPDNVKAFSDVIGKLSLVMMRRKTTAANPFMTKAKKIIGSFGATAAAVGGIERVVEVCRK